VFPERIIDVLQVGILRDPILCRALRGEARGSPDGSHLTKRNAKTPVALNEHLVCCLGHWSDITVNRVYRAMLASSLVVALVLVPLKAVVGGVCWRHQGCGSKHDAQDGESGK